MTRISAGTMGAFLVIFVAEAGAQYRPPPPAPTLPPLTSTNTRNIYAPWSGSNLGGSNSLPTRVLQQGPLRAVPLPPDTLQNSALPAPAPPSVFAVPYGPNMSRPPGSPIVPFGASGYYYRRR